jgi:hypothetical protein
VIEKLRPGLWTWTAAHPSWTPEQGGPNGWEQDVRSYALDAGDALVLFDPQAEVADVETLADGRPVVVVLTCFWHRRSTSELVEALDATVHAPAVDLGELGLPAKPYAVGDDLAGDVEPHPGAYPNECTLWIRGHSALVIRDALLGGGRGFRLQPESWLAEGDTTADLQERLRPLLELPADLLLPTHGVPVADDARGELRRALSA